MKKTILISGTLCFLWLSHIASQNRGDLLSDTLIMSLRKSEILDIYHQFGLPPFIIPIFYDFQEIHKLTYISSAPTGDSLTIASGLITIPVNQDCDFPLLSYQHGTLPYDSILSGMNAKFGQHFFGVPFAANGYVTILPDYLGLGTTNLPHHPFTHANSEAAAVIDLIRAARKFCLNRKIQLNGQVFLLGYSQGGHATMAAHRSIQKNYSEEIQISASAPGGGAYNLSGISRDSMLFSEKFSNPYFISYAIIAYQYVYEGLYDKIEEIFVHPYDSMVLKIFNRENPDSRWIDSLPKPGIKILHPSYLQQIIDDDQHPLNLILKDNDVYDWLPKAPIRLFYCENDEVVPPANTLFTYQYMLELGAQEISIYEGGTLFNHASCTYPSILGAKLWFEQYRKPCSVNMANGYKTLDIFSPNPFRDKVLIKQVVHNRMPSYVHIHDSSGRLIRIFNNCRTEILCLKDLPEGLYYFNYQIGNQKYWQRMVKI